MSRSPRPSLWWIGAFALLACLLFCGGPIAYVIQARSAVEEFSARHVEAAPLIDDILAYYQKTGQWPPPDEAQAMVEQHGLDTAWTYLESDGDIPSRLSLHGPLHGRLIYHFDTRGAGHWELSVEGSIIRKW